MTGKIWGGGLGAVAFLLLPALALGQLSQGKKDTIFIGKMKAQSSVQQLADRQGKQIELSRVSQSLETQFISAVSSTRVFQLVDRKRIAEIQREQAFAAVSVAKEAAQIGQMTGAKYALLPEIDGFEIRTDVDKYQAIGRESKKYTYFLSALVQVVDTTTGELLPDAPSVQLSKVETIKMAYSGAAQSSDRVLVELAKEMAGRLSREVISLLRPAKVLDVTGSQIMINRGEDAGFQMGKGVEIFAVKKIVDPDTGESFSNEIPVGKAKITRSDRKKSFAVLSGDNLGVSPGCIVKVSSGTTLPRVVPPVTFSGGERKDGTAASSRSSSPETPGSSSQPINWGK